MAMDYSKDNLRLIGMIGKKFANDVLGFYSTMMRRYSGGIDEGRKRELNVEKERAQYIGDLVDKILDPGRTSFPQKEVDELMKEMGIAESKMKGLIADSETDTSLNAKMEKVTYQKGLDAKKISEAINAARGRMEKVSSGSSPLTKLAGIMPEAFGGAADIGGSIAKSMLGTYGGLGEGIFKTVGGMYARAQEKKKTLAQRAFEGKMLNVGETPKQFMDVSTLLGGGSDLISKIFGGGFAPGGSAGVGGSRSGARSKSGVNAESSKGQTMGDVLSSIVGIGGMGGVGGGGMVTPQIIHDGLHMFFDHKAFHSKWTKELLKAVKAIGDKDETIGEKSNKAESGIGWMKWLWAGIKKLGPAIVAFFTGLGELLVAALPALGIALGAAALVAAAIAADWAIGKFLGKGAQTATRMAGPAGIGLGIADKIGEWAGWKKPKVTKAGEDSKLGHAAVNTSDSSSSTLTEKNESVTKSLSSSTSKIQTMATAAATGKIPIAGPVGVGETIQNNDRLHKTLSALIDEVKKMGKAVPEGLPLSGFDAFNIRNPLLSAMSTGGVEIDE